MTLVEKTQQIIELRTGAAEGALRAGRLLNEIRAGKQYAEGGKYRTFGDYLSKELPSMERSWAFLSMKVAEHFTEAQAREYGIKPLACLCNLAREVFPDQTPAELLTGEHRLTDSEGVEHVLDFQTDHSVATLKTLISTGRDARDHAEAPKPISVPLLPLATALQAVAASTGVAVQLREKKALVSVELTGDPKVVVAAMKEVAGRL